MAETVAQDPFAEIETLKQTLQERDLRIAIYARVSSEQQAQAATIESQIHDLKHFIFKIITLNSFAPSSIKVK